MHPYCPRLTGINEVVVKRLIQKSIEGVSQPEIEDEWQYDQDDPAEPTGHKSQPGRKLPAPQQRNGQYKSDAHHRTDKIGPEQESQTSEHTQQNSGRKIA